MHVGHAIEGSIGTEMKIDPLYLSQDVQIAERLEGLNEAYGTQILLTGELNELLSEKGQAAVRKIDQVLLKEAGRRPVEVYCFDMRPIDPLTIEDEDEEDLLGVLDMEKAPREIGEYI